MRRLLGVLALFTALAADAVGAAAQCPDGTPPPCAGARRTASPLHSPPPAAVRARRLLLLPFRNVTRGAAQDWLVTGGPLILGEALSQFRDLTVVPEEQVAAARRRLGFRSDSALDATQLRRLAEETDGWTAVTGNVLAGGGRLRISAQALDILTARVLVRCEAEAATDADVRPAFDKLSAQLLDAAGMHGATLDVAAHTTNSVDAYRAYVQGVDFMQRSAYRRAQKAFAEAVRLDSSFALAWAKLAMASTSASIWDLLDPTNPITHAINRAADNASQLPPRQAQLVRAMQAFFQGQPARARRLADSLVRTDRDDLDAREWLASVAIMDPSLDTTAHPARMATSLNRAIELAREILDRDPGRRNVYSVPAMVYAIGSGLWGAVQLGVSGDAGSFGALVARAMSRPDAAFIPVVGDSIVTTPFTEFLRLPEDEQLRLRRRSADAGMEWVERWLAAGPNDADAHGWASRLSALRGDYPRALRELAVAESLGVESSWENLGGAGRVRLLALMGNYPAAAALADSLLTAGQLAKFVPFVGAINQEHGYAAALFLVTKRWSRLAALADAASRTMPGTDGCLTLITELDRPLKPLNVDVLRAAMDSAAVHFAELTTFPSLANCVGNLAGALVTDSAARHRTLAASALVRTGDSLHVAGNEAFAYRAMRVAWNADSAAQARMMTDAWFVDRSRTMALGHNFVPSSAVVDGDSATFVFRRLSAEPVELSYPGLPSYWAFRVDIPGDSVAFTVRASHMWRSRDGLRSGGLPEMIAGLQTQQVLTPGSAIGAASRVAATIAADGFRLVVHGPVIAELRRLRPTTATFGSEPCLAVTDGLCARPSLAIVYR